MPKEHLTRGPTNYRNVLENACSSNYFQGGHSQVRSDSPTFPGNLSYIYGPHSTTGTQIRHFWLICLYIYHKYCRGNTRNKIIFK